MSDLTQSIIESTDWVKENLPALQCIKPNVEGLKPVVEFWTPSLQTNFSDIFQLISEKEDIDVETWRIINTIHKRSARKPDGSGGVPIGKSSMVLVEKEFFDIVSNAVKYRISPSVLEGRTIVSVPKQYKVAGKLELSNLNDKLLTIVSLQALCSINQNPRTLTRMQKSLLKPCRRCKRGPQSKAINPRACAHRTRNEKFDSHKKMNYPQKKSLPELIIIVAQPELCKEKHFYEINELYSTSEITFVNIKNDLNKATLKNLLSLLNKWNALKSLMLKRGNSLTNFLTNKLRRNNHNWLSTIRTPIIASPFVDKYAEDINLKVKHIVFCVTTFKSNEICRTQELSARSHRD